MSELPEFTVVQLEFHYPDDSMNKTIMRLNETMLLDGWQGVGVISSQDSEALYVVYEKLNESDVQAILPGK